MGKNEYLDGENLEWQERLFRLRKKYRETPPGFREAEEEEKSLRDLRRIRKEYEERKKYRIRSGYRALQECFVGRERYLTRIEEILAEKSGPAVLYGIGGIGKTAIARAYVRRHQEEYDSVLFLSCDIGFSPLLCDDIRVAVSNLHYSKDKYGSKKQYFKEKMKAMTEIGEESRFLLVLDDCNREADPYMEQIFALPCDILVTTRVDPAMWGVAGGIPVTELEPGREWEEFVRAYRGSEPTQEEWKEYREYRERIGGHTLLMMLKLHGVEPGKDASGTMEMIAKDMFRRFPLKKWEKQALRELSLMPVQGISEDLYYQVSGMAPGAVERLEDRLLIRREEKEGKYVLSLHPIIAKAARDVFVPTQTNCRMLLHGFYKIARNSWNRTYLENQEIEPYIFAFLNAFSAPKPWLFREYGAFIAWLWIQGYFEEAEKCCRSLVCQMEACYGAVHQATGETYLWMAAVYYNSMNFEKADVWYEKGFQSLNACRPFDDRYFNTLGTSYAKLSRSARYRGDLELALDLADEALKIGRKYWDLCEERGVWYEESDAQNTWCHWLLNKARILYDMGRLQEAWELGHQAWKGVWDEVQEGKNYGYELVEFERFLVKALMALEDYGRAEEVAEEMLKTALAYRMEGSKEVLSCREQMADLYLKMGDEKKAAGLYGEIIQKLMEDFPYQKDWIRKIQSKWKAAGGNVKVHLIDGE